jgi:WD40 repeat protein
VSGGEDKSIRIWDANTGNCVHDFRAHDDYVNSVKFHPSGDYLISGSEDKTVKIWDYAAKECTLILEGHTDNVYDVAISNDGKLVASASTDKTIKLWDFSTGDCLFTLEGHTDKIRSVSFSPNDKLLVSGSEDTSVRLWRIDTALKAKQEGTTLDNDAINVMTYEGKRFHKADVNGVDFSLSGNEVVSVGEDKLVMIMQVPPDIVNDITNQT